MSMQVYVVLATLVATIYAQAPFTVNTPPSVQACLPVQLSWTGGQPPVYVSLIPGGQPGGAPIKDFGAQNASPITWNVDQPVGTSLTVQIRDSTGAINYSDKFTVQPSGQSCSASNSSSAGASPTSSKPASPGTTSAAPAPHNSANSSATTTKPGNTTSTPGSTTPSTGTSSSTSPSSSGTPNGGAAAGAPNSGASTMTPGLLTMAVAALVFVAA